MLATEESFIMPSSQRECEQYCSICQYPFVFLKIKTPTEHTLECKTKTPRRVLYEECPEGASCSSKMETHYQLFTHKTLGESRNCVVKDAISDKGPTSVIDLTDGQTSSEEFVLAPTATPKSSCNFPKSSQIKTPKNVNSGVLKSRKVNNIKIESKKSPKLINSGKSPGKIMSTKHTLSPWSIALSQRRLKNHVRPDICIDLTEEDNSSSSTISLSTQKDNLKENKTVCDNRTGINSIKKPFVSLKNSSTKCKARKRILESSSDDSGNDGNKKLKLGTGMSFNAAPKSKTPFCIERSEKNDSTKNPDMPQSDSVHSANSESQMSVNASTEDSESMVSHTNIANRGAGQCESNGTMQINAANEGTSVKDVGSTNQCQSLETLDSEDFCTPPPKGPGFVPKAPIPQDIASKEGDTGFVDEDLFVISPEVGGFNASSDVPAVDPDEGDLPVHSLKVCGDVISKGTDENMLLSKSAHHSTEDGHSAIDSKDSNSREGKNISPVGQNAKATTNSTSKVASNFLNSEHTSHNARPSSSDRDHDTSILSDLFDAVTQPFVRHPDASLNVLAPDSDEENLPVHSSLKVCTDVISNGRDENTLLSKSGHHLTGDGHSAIGCQDSNSREGRNISPVGQNSQEITNSTSKVASNLLNSEHTSHDASPSSSDSDYDKSILSDLFDAVTQPFVGHPSTFDKMKQGSPFVETKSSGENCTEIYKSLGCRSSDTSHPDDMHFSDLPTQRDFNNNIANTQELTTTSLSPKPHNEDLSDGRRHSEEVCEKSSTPSGSGLSTQKIADEIQRTKDITPHGQSTVTHEPTLDGSKSTSVFQISPVKNPSIVVRNDLKKAKTIQQKQEKSNSVYRCPSYKKIAGTDIAVDAFSYGSVPGINYYFLSHWHSDEYKGIHRTRWKHKIYCGKITGNLVAKKMRISEDLLVRLPLWEENVVGNVCVTLLDAKHCPGAVLFLFKLRNNHVILHTGDFHASSEMAEYSTLQGMKISTIHLDTTYLNPEYRFPPRSTVISAAVQIAREALSESEKTLVVIGTYDVGKERIFIDIAKAVKSKVFVTESKSRIIQCLEDKELNKLVTTSSVACKVHVVPMRSLTVKKLTLTLTRYSAYDKIVAIKPTGWGNGEFNSRSFTTEMYESKNIKIFQLPYSDHSGFDELHNFVKRFKPSQIIQINPNGRVSRSKSRYLEAWKSGLEIPEDD